MHFFSTQLRRLCVAAALGFAAQAQAVNVDFQITKTWTGGYNTDVVISNDGAAVSGWTLSFNLGHAIKSASRATLSGSDPYTLSSLSYSANIASGSSETVKYTGAANWSASGLKNCVFNGKACTLLVNGKAIGGSTSSVSSSAKPVASSSSSSSKPAVSSASSSAKPVVSSSSSKPSVASSSSAKPSVASSSSAKPVASSSSSKSAASSSSVASSKASGAFVHPGVFNTKSQLLFVKGKINAGSEPWKSAFDRLKKVDPLSHTINAKTIVTGSADPADRKDMDAMTLDFEYLNASALLWYFTGEQKYADYAISGLNAWSKLDKFQGMPLYMTWAAPHLINAAEIMKHTPGTSWQKADIDKFSAMVAAKIWNKVIIPPGPNGTLAWGSNHASTAIHSQLSIAVFLDDKAKFDSAVSNYKTQMPATLFLNKAGRYDGEAAETCRDLSHATLSATGLMYAAEVAWNQGVDLWNADKTRWTKFAELHAGFKTGKTKVPSNMCAYKSGQAGIVWCSGAVPWGDASKSGQPPCGEVAWEVLTDQIGDRLGASIPITREMTESNRPLGAITRRVSTWETLLKANLPE